MDMQTKIDVAASAMFDRETSDQGKNGLPIGECRTLARIALEAVCAAERALQPLT